MTILRPGFVPSDECASIVAAIRRAAPGPDARVQPKRVEIDGLACRRFPHIYDFVTRFRASATKELAMAFPRPSPSFIEFTLLTEMKDGDAHALHADNEKRTLDGEWIPNHTPWRDCTALLYLNTSGVDYTGGVLHFPRRGQTVTPAAGTLVGFTCGRDDQHEVTRVSGGSRYSVAVWTTLDPDFAEAWDPIPASGARQPAGPDR